MNPVHPGFNLPGEPGSVIYDYPFNFNVTNATEAAVAASASASQSSANAAKAGPAGPTMTPNYLRTPVTPGVRDVNHPPYVINHVQGVCCSFPLTLSRLLIFSTGLGRPCC